MHGVSDRVRLSRNSHIASLDVAFRHLHDVGAFKLGDFAAQYPAYKSPSQRFSTTLTDAGTWFRAGWFARPSPYGTFTRYFLPVLIGASEIPLLAPCLVRYFLS
jgi:hypothetical protein